MDPDSLHTHTTSGLHNVSSYLRLLLASLVFYKTCGFYVVNLFSKGPPPLKKKKKLCINKHVLAVVMQFPEIHASTKSLHNTLASHSTPNSPPLYLRTPFSDTAALLHKVGLI